MTYRVIRLYLKLFSCYEKKNLERVENKFFWGKVSNAFQIQLFLVHSICMNLKGIFY